MEKMHYPHHPLDEQLEFSLKGDFYRGGMIAHHFKRYDPENVRALFNRGWFEMADGNLLEGFKCLGYGRWIGVFGGQALPTNKPIYKDQDLKGKHVLMCSEGGLGDEIINARFAKEFAERGAKVAITCDPSLMSVFARIEGVSTVVAHKAAPDVYHDYWVPAMSAGHVLGVEYENLRGDAYLTVDENYQKKWSQLFAMKFKGSKRPRIGVRFYGNPKFSHEEYRQFPRELMLNALDGRDFISLQKEETDLPLDTWEDTLAVIDQLDLVITSCTSVAHASAALGKETWVIVPRLPYYLWSLPGNSSPWYNSVRLFRQRVGEDGWGIAFDEVQKELKQRGF